MTVVLAALLLLSPACREPEFAIDLLVERGGVPAPTSISFTIEALDAPGGAILATTTATYGADFFATEPSTNRLFIRTGDRAGAVEIRAVATDSAGLLAASGSVVVLREPTIVLATLTLRARECGDGIAEGPETCDGDDLAGFDCRAADSTFVGGPLLCAATCDTFDTSGCSDLPTVPVPLLPRNDAWVGSAAVPGSMRPTFEWTASTALGLGVIIYELAYALDPAFPAAGTTVEINIPGTSFQPPADLPVELAVPPLGARYHWRVRACIEGFCSDWSRAPWLNLGRSDRDFDGDAWPDLAIAAPANDAAGLDAGAVLIYAGGSATAISGAPSLALEGEAPGDAFGYAVAAAGDLDADGFADLVVGAPGNDVAGADAGRAYIYYGSAVGLVSGTLLNGTIDADFFGAAVAGAGDLNGDGFGDLVVGAPGYDRGAAFLEPDTGGAWVYFGGPPPLDINPEGLLLGELSGHLFGASVSGAGDFDGDLHADLIVGAPGASTNDGRAYVFAGGAGLTFEEVPEMTIGLGVAAGARFGRAVACAGDVDRDGYADLIVGAPEEGNFITPNLGKVYLYRGGEGLFDSTADWTYAGLMPNFFLGEGVGGGGDLNGDGVDDLVTGAAGVGGRVFVWFGVEGGLPDMADQGEAWLGEAPDDLFGYAVEIVGDVDGDGFADVLVGAPGQDGGAMDGGAVYLFLGGMGSILAPTPADVLLGIAAGDVLGFAL